MDNQEIDKKQSEIDRKETIINLKKTIKKLQLTLDKIDKSEIEEFPSPEITNIFLESSNDLIDNIKLAPRFQVKTESESLPADTPDNSIPKPSTKKRFSFDFRLGAIALGSLIIIVGICWAIINPTPEITDNNQDNTAIVAVETPEEEDKTPPEVPSVENITPDNLDTETDNQGETEIIPEDNQPPKPKESTQISPPSIDEDVSSEKEAPTIPDKEVEIIIEEKTVSALTMEQTLLNNIQEQIDQITDKYGKNLIINLRANFSDNYLLVTLTQYWYQMSSSEQDNFVNDVYQRAKLLYFNKINFQDSQENLVARNAVIGDKMIVTQR
ncbi:hypothetical protein Cyast_2229 [Cyanobacterium stanieri PCC 7202]|uniref:Uncharacterized protein n=1 Tax=Cyanobacterium stanieri (strain ATCC 29140 / PCC 7202) TaxID=292563 RepID=K9YQ17_CYASC|nr:hypothetical protein Cyast_2229 [Cyanobacterium stanieri PCC 7202]